VEKITETVDFCDSASLFCSLVEEFKGKSY
jgi:hypothetical protein